jgi:light-regulated signal transduction histidine kinase (bacteriophytochrome)
MITEDGLSARPDLLAGLAQEMRRDWRLAYLYMERVAYGLDHDLRNARTSIVLLKNLLEQARGDCTSQDLVRRIDYILGGAE